MFMSNEKIPNIFNHPLKLNGGLFSYKRKDMHSHEL